MSIHERAAAALMAHLTLTADGALLGVGVAYVAYVSIRRYFTTVSAIGKIRQAPSVQPSDLRSILSGDKDSGENFDFNGGKLVIVRGAVEVKSALEEGSWKNLKSSGAGADFVVSQETGERGVILQRTQTCVYNEWKGFLGWTMDLRSILARSHKEHETSTTRMVPFILVEDAKWPPSDYVVVNMEGCQSHSLPLTTVYQNLQPINASPLTVLQAFFGLEYPIGVLSEEKILPLGKNITAVGICNFKDGIPEIKSGQDLPWFLSDLTKDEILTNLNFKANVLMWSGIVFGTVAVGLIGYSIARNWVRYKEWRRRQQTQQQINLLDNQAGPEAAAEEETGEIPDGELCVVCLMRRRRSAFVPCGHLVCCQRCALSVEREASPKCPVCRQPIRNSVRIYDS